MQNTLRQPRGSVGRYGSRRGASAPGGGLARAVPSLHVRTAVGVVPNPLGPSSNLVAINRNVDLLELERSHRRISESAYQTGRLIQTILEDGDGLGELNLERSPSGRASTDNQVVYGLMDAQTREHWLGRIKNVVGDAGARFLRHSLSGNVSFPQLAERYGRHGEKGISATASMWRWMLEQLADAWAARGVRPKGEPVYALRPEGEQQQRV